MMALLWALCVSTAARVNAELMAVFFFFFFKDFLQKLFTKSIAPRDIYIRRDRGYFESPFPKELSVM